MVPRSLQPDEATRLLTDPTRFQIYRSVMEAGEKGATTAQIAEQFGVHRNVARMHLEKLSRAGLLKSSLRKPSSGGRPAREYRVGETVTKQFPPRDYKLLAEVALTALEEQEEPQKVARRMGRGIGKRGLAQAGLNREIASRAQLIASFMRVTEEQGLFARIRSASDEALEIEVLNCVFKELSARHATMICGLHGQLFLGICEAHFGKVKVKKKGHIEIAQGGMSCQYTVQPRS